MSAYIFRHRTTLFHSGLAVIAFGLWSIVRALLVVYFRLSEIRAIPEQSGVDLSSLVDPQIIVNVTLTLIFVMLALDLLFRLYIGLFALREGMGRRGHKRYPLFCALHLGFSLFGAVLLLLSSIGDGLTMRSIAAALVDFSSCIAFWEILRSSRAIRQYQISEQGENYAA